MPQTAFSESFSDAFEIQEAISAAAANTPLRSFARLADALSILEDRNTCSDLSPPELEAAIRLAADQAGVRIIPD